MPAPEVRAGRFHLTAVQNAHIEPIRNWRNRQMDVLRQTRPISESEQADYYATHIWPTMDHACPANVLVTYFRDGMAVGYGGLVHVAWEHLRAEISFILDPDAFGDEVAYAALFMPYLGLIQRLAFDELRLERLWTETYAFRREHIRCLELAGLKPEGILRNHVRVNGQAVDSLLHARLHDDAQ